MKFALVLRLLSLFATLWLATAAAAAERTVLLYGDSLLAGYGLAAEDGFEAQLQAALDAAGLDVRLVNASVSGDTTADGLERLDWTLGEPPDAVILGLGANDMLRALPPAAAEANLDAMLTTIREADLPVLLLGMLADRGLGADYVQAFDGLYPRLAARHDALLYPFYLQAIGLAPKFYQADRQHPNAEGVRRIVADLLPLVKALLAQVD